MECTRRFAPTRRSVVMGLGAAAAVSMLGGCAARLRQEGRSGSTGPWTGRLAVQIDDAAMPSYPALFELEGSAAEGRLTLLSPLGTVLGRAEWGPHGALLVSGQSREQADSLDGLMTRLTGAPLPVAALFDWLQVLRTVASGWSLESLDSSRIVAQREHPLPRVSLRLAVSH